MTAASTQAAMRGGRGWSRPLIAALLAVTLAIIVLVPILFMFVGSVLSGGLASPGTHFTLANLARVYATSPYIWTTISTVLRSAEVGLIATVAGVLMAWLTARTDLPGLRAMEFFVVAPLFLSPFVGAIAWLVLGSPRAGLINLLATQLFGIQGPVIDVATPTGITLIMALYYVPYAYLTVAASMKNIDPSMEEAAHLNGSGLLATTWRITLPVVRPSLVSAFFFVFVLSAGTFSIPAVLDRTGHMPFLAVDIYQASANYPVDYGTSAALGTVLFLISIIGIAGYRHTARSAKRFVTVTARGFRVRRTRLGFWRYPAALLMVLYVLLSVVVPYLGLSYAAFARYTSGNLLDAKLSIDGALGVARSRETVGSIIDTLYVGIITPTACVLLGLGVSYAIRRLKIPAAGFLDYAAMMPIAVPGIIFGTGIFWTYLLTPIYGTIWVLVLAFVASYLPFSYRFADTALLQIDPALEEASALNGASHWRTASRITVPLIQPALISAWVMIFIFSVREISAAILLTSTDNVVLSVLSWSYLDYGDMQKGAVIGLLQTAILVVGMIAARLAFRVRLSHAP